MYVVIIRMDGSPSRFPVDADLHRVLQTVAEGTDVGLLGVDIYLVPNSSAWRGHCRRPRRDARAGQAVPGSAPPVTGSTGLADAHGRSHIRIILGDKWLGGGEITTRYGMQLKCPGFAEAAAFLFAHELHHYRRYHLGLHPGEGEVSADRWALERVRQAGFAVQAKRVAVTGRKRRPRVAADDAQAARQLMMLGRHAGMGLRELADQARRLDQQVAGRDVSKALHYELLRRLPDNTPLRICRAGSAANDAMHVGQIVRKIRTPRGGSYRMPVRFADGRQFYWPMEWLEMVGE